MQPIQRTLLIVSVLLLSALISFWLTGSQLVSAARSSSFVPVANSMPVSFPGADSVRLDGAWLEPALARAVVVLAHALRSERHGMESRAQFLVRNGFAVLVFDQRAHGTSGGRWVTYGAREAADLRAAVAFARTRRPELPVLVHGVSLGAAAAVLAGPQLGADALVIESLYPTVDAAVEHRLRQRYGAIAPYLTSLFVWQMEVRIGLSFDAMQPARALHGVQVPVLMIAGTEDPVTPARESLWMYGALPGVKRLWLVGGASHQDLYGYKPQEYEQRVIAFLDSVMLAAVAPTTTIE